MLSDGAVAFLAANSDIGKAGPIGLFVILLMGAAVLLLTRSMLRHLKRIPPTFDTQPGPSDRSGEAR